MWAVMYGFRDRTKDANRLADYESVKKIEASLLCREQVVAYGYFLHLSWTSS